MWRWRRVAVARVFALVMRCRIMMLVVFSRVGKNRDTRRKTPATAGAGRLVFARRLQPLSRADKSPTGFGVPVWRIGAQKPVAVRKANDIYRPVRASFYSQKFFNISFYVA